MTVLLLEQIAHTQVEESAMGFEVAFSGEVEKAKIVTHIEAELVDGSRMEMELKPCWPEKENRRRIITESHSKGHDGV